jgi:cobalt-zinc-cadmium efflux system protein
MAHYRKAVAGAVALNTGIFVVEAVAGFRAHSLSLLMDGVHNLSDEMALVFIYLALSCRKESRATFYGLQISSTP